MIAIIDYGMGNLRSVQKGFEHVGFDAIVTRDVGANHIRPRRRVAGCGRFQACMENLGKFGLIEPIRDIVRQKKPFLGICLGFQLLFSESEEFGKQKGLDLFPGKVVGFQPNNGLKVPHMGWNRYREKKGVAVFRGDRQRRLRLFCPFLLCRSRRRFGDCHHDGLRQLLCLQHRNGVACLPANFTRRRARRSACAFLQTSAASSPRIELCSIIPAIDLKDGRCVRLFQGEMDKETIYFESPLDAARHWLEEGATFIHIVDLEWSGRRPTRCIRVKSKPSAKKPDCRWNSAAACDRSKPWRRLSTLGVSRVVIGTAAYDNAGFLRALCKKFPGKIVVGIDARQGKVAVKGWKETTSMDAVELAKRCEQDGASRIIYTDISRDGTREGVNVDETLKIARSVRIPIIASGGVATLDDIRNLRPLEKAGVEGVIVGRALYGVSFSFRDAAIAVS